MKKIIPFIALTAALLVSTTTNAQEKKEDKTKRPSPPAVVTKTFAQSGLTLTIDYSQPSVKGRTIGKDLEPKEGEVWRTGANEATTFEVSQDVLVEGKKLPKGKYSLFTISGKDSWTIIINKTANQWGAYDYKQADDALRVTVKPGKAEKFAEKMTFSIDEKGMVTLLWGDLKVSFSVM
jgi:hypothetical protein